MIPVALRYGTASVDDSITWGQLRALFSARVRAEQNPEEAAGLMEDVVRIFVTGWDLTDRAGARLAFPDDMARVYAGDILTLQGAILAMLREAGVEIGEGGPATASANPTGRPPSASSPTATSRPARGRSSRRP